MKTNKYYTPNLEEFCVGFEFEDSYGDGEYAKNSIDQLNIKDVIGSFLKKEVDIRVKYLDSEDIESLGFKYCKKSDLATIYSYKDYFIAYYNSGHISITEIGEMCRRDTILFNGRIKNKSELKRILKMIGVTE